MKGSIFSNPNLESRNQFGHSVLFFHGLEGSPNGSKAEHLKNQWGAMCPPLRTEKIKELARKKGIRPWSELDRDEVEEALEPVISDALDAVNYAKPDIIIGSSMGAAILFKLALDNNIDLGDCSLIFLAPAISELVQPKGNMPEINNSFWLLGETDTVVDNRANIEFCKSCKGNLFFSPGDGHRLSGALRNGLIDGAILSAIELRASLGY